MNERYMQFEPLNDVPTVPVSPAGIDIDYVELIGSRIEAAHKLLGKHILDGVAEESKILQSKGFQPELADFLARYWTEQALNERAQLNWMGA